ncbi:hypothetical protein FHS43_006702 [Streptosporangium becharense]|uniref:DUF1877 domain-containing protein n=1 Tax=Streptosporangium becharense TaxID=1816182 RepID=A0A7W9IN00_9ACTN|nr:DUF1877 family protein [Streptosporangium becharense]MBB2915382.1 hypothetical protein [Streptosporangium becharense]MBB5823732.1 hypothetical protein [Streptosporangium becharense]
MSLDGRYLRVTAAEVTRMIRDPEGAYEFASGLPDDRELWVHKAWMAISIILRRAGHPLDLAALNVADGEKTLPVGEWGGQILQPPKYLDAHQVRIAAEALSRTSYDGLIGGIDPKLLSKCYGLHGKWDEKDVEWVRLWFEPVIPFFEATAGEGDAILAWID